MHIQDLLGAGTVAEGEPVNFVVPTGNFGNILAAFYAKNMGIPVGKLICASNENKVLYDFFDTGVYDRNREFVSDKFAIYGYSDLQQLRAFDLSHCRRRRCRRRKK